MTEKEKVINRYMEAVEGLIRAIRNTGKEENWEEEFKSHTHEIRTIEEEWRRNYHTSLSFGRGKTERTYKVFENGLMVAIIPVFC